MKIAIDIRVYNFRMRNRRKELGLTQMELAIESRVGIDSIGKYERMEMPRTKETDKIRGHLHRIADCLYMDFDELFPEEYLEMIRLNLLPKSSRFQWLKEVSLDMLQAPADEVELFLPRPSELVDIELLKTALEAETDKLTDRERDVIRLRFGFEDGIDHTLEEVGKIITEREGIKKTHNSFGPYITRERIRQIEEHALRKLRHPRSTKNLRGFV